MLYNRRRKKVYFALLAEKNHELLLSAIEAERAGEPLSKDQQSILDRERNRLRYEDEQAEKKKRGWGIQEFLIGGLKMSEVEGDEVEVEVEVEVEGAREPEGEVMKAVEEKKREDEMDLMKNRNGGAGGSLDRMAERAAELGKSKIGWGSWWGRK